MAETQPSQKPDFTEAITEFRSGCENLNDVFEHAFTEVDDLWNELLGKLADFEELRRQNDEVADEFVESRAEYQEALAASRAELERVVSELQQQRDAAEVAAHENESLAARLESLQSERGELQQALDDAQINTPNRQELKELRDEREELLLELEVVRTRAAELHEHIIEQQREFTERRAELVDEMRNMRGLLEHQAELLSTEPQTVAPSQRTKRTGSRTARPAKSHGDDAPADAVVGAVMAQFSKLQQDRAKRRQPTR